MPLLSGLGHLCKKTAFTVFRKNTEAKGVSFGWRFKIEMFLSVFSVESYIFKKKYRHRRLTDTSTQFWDEMYDVGSTVY